MDHQTLIGIVCAVLVGAVFGVLADRLIAGSAFHADGRQDGYRHQGVWLDDAAPKLIEVHRTDIDGSGVQIDENHMLPAEVAARLFGGKRSATHDNFFDEV
jgi:hypothetical protein